jgi:hypothetical protein
MRAPHKRRGAPPIWLWAALGLFLAVSVGCFNLTLLFPDLTPLQQETALGWGILAWLITIFLGATLFMWVVLLLVRWLTERLGGVAAGSGRRDGAPGG